MTHFDDLSPYTYHPQGESMVNVGWLSKDHEFTTGHVPELVRNTLVDLAANHPQNVMRGLHYCDFCDADSPLTVTRSDDASQSAHLGFSEIHVRAGGVTYAAPTLVIHYIDDHDYLPPREFCDAVLALEQS